MKTKFCCSSAGVLVAVALTVSCSSDDPSSEVSAPAPVGAGAGSAVAGAGTGGGTSGASSGASGGGQIGASSAAGAGVPGATAGATQGAGMPGATAGGATTGGMVTTETKVACEKKVRTADKTVPDFMIVLDRSSSMRTMIGANVRCNDPMATTQPAACGGIDCATAQWMSTTVCGGTMPATVDRWAPAVTALKSLTAMFETKVSFGLTTYPGEGPGGGRNAQCTTGNLRVPIATMTAGAIATALDGTQPGGYTPTAATLQAVLKAVQDKKTAPDSQLPPQFVLLVTDGSPNCVGQDLNNDQQAHQATIQAIDALAMAGVKTYVIGYDASVDPRLAMQLAEYAQHGGTNNFYAVQDGPSLVSKFTEITSVVAECTYNLDMKPADKRYVRVELDKESLKLDDADGWSLNDQTVTINGAACAKLRDGSKTHTLAVTVECAVVEIK